MPSGMVRPPDSTSSMFTETEPLRFFFLPLTGFAELFAIYFLLLCNVAFDDLTGFDGHEFPVRGIDDELRQLSSVRRSPNLGHVVRVRPDTHTVLDPPLGLLAHDLFLLPDNADERLADDIAGSVDVGADAGHNPRRYRWVDLVVFALLAAVFLLVCDEDDLVEVYQLSVVGEPGLQIARELAPLLVSLERFVVVHPEVLSDFLHAQILEGGDLVEDDSLEVLSFSEPPVEIEEVLPLLDLGDLDVLHVLDRLQPLLVVDVEEEDRPRIRRGGLGLPSSGFADKQGDMVLLQILDGLDTGDHGGDLGSLRFLLTRNLRHSCYLLGTLLRCSHAYARSPRPARVARPRRRNGSRTYCS